MFKRKRENKRCSLLEIVGYLLIIMSISLLGYKIYTSMNYEMEELILIEDFYDRYGDKSMTPIIEEENIIEEDKEEKKEIPVNNIKYIGVLKINKINLERGLVDKTSSYNHVDQNIQILKESDMPNIEKGNLILAAHSGNGRVAYFRDLHKLKINDLVSVYYEGFNYVYEVVNIYEIAKTGEAHIIRNASKNTLTLITCKGNEEKQIIIICELKERK